MSKNTDAVIRALEPHRKLISGAIAFRMKDSLTEEDAMRRSENAVRGFVCNNAASLGLDSVRCVCWEEVVMHFKEAQG